MDKIFFTRREGFVGSESFARLASPGPDEVAIYHTNDERQQICADKCHCPGFGWPAPLGPKESRTTSAPAGGSGRAAMPNRRP